MKFGWAMMHIRPWFDHNERTEVEVGRVLTKIWST